MLGKPGCKHLCKQLGAEKNALQRPLPEEPFFTTPLMTIWAGENSSVPGRLKNQMPSDTALPHYGVMCAVMASSGLRMQEVRALTPKSLVIEKHGEK